ncbi:MAG: AAA family ATPase [Alphaproteobacteria bacterium]|nr:AAA family ATPase [Alphaproteobacteria bacterium]
MSFSSKFVVFFGQNGAGKTNILEAISLFASDRGLRKAPISDLNTINTQSGSWNLELVVKKGEYRSFLSTHAPLGRRIAKIDNSVVNSLSKFEDEIWLLWVIPAMDNIFIDAMSERRSFFDHLVSGYEKRHKHSLKKLNLLQKERLHIIFNRKDENWLDAVEKKIAEENIELTKNRLNFISLLEDTFDNYPSKFLRPKIKISGTIEQIYENNSEENALLEIALALKKSRYEDAEKQTTSIGAQKTFWEVYHEKSGFEAANCSTGEQKAFLISLVLAALRIYKDMRTGVPILLLDDLMVHLDKTRRQDLIDELISIDAQTFLTGTDAELFAGFSGAAQMYHVNNSICELYFSNKT